MYRLPLLPPSRLAAFLNTSEFSARELHQLKRTLEVGIFKGQKRAFQVILGFNGEGFLPQGGRKSWVVQHF